MEYEEFKDALVEELKRIMEKDNATIRLDTVTKSNDIKMDSISIGFPESQLEPQFYIAQQYALYERAYPVNFIANCIAIEARKSIYAYDEIPPINRENAEKNLYCTLMNANQNKEYLKNVPFEKFFDLAIVPRYRLDIDAGGSILVTENMCSMDFKMTKEEMLEVAIRNTREKDYQCTKVTNMMEDMLSKSNIPIDERELAEELIYARDTNTELYVVSNTDTCDGAIAMACPDVMQSVAEKLGDDFYIMPSSRHEVMVIRDDGIFEPDDLKELVEECNRFTISKTDFLSDNVYRYDTKTNKITMVGSETETITDEIIPTKEKSHTLSY